MQMLTYPGINSPQLNSIVFVDFARTPQLNLFNLKSLIKDKFDWYNAYLLSQTILLELQDPLKQDSFVQVASQMLLTTSILVSRQTIYPDLLTVRTFILLPKLTMRIFDADINQNLTNLGPEVDDGFQYILDIPNNPTIFETIVEAIVGAIDSYLYKINQADFNLMLDVKDYKDRANYLDRVLPLPPSEIISELLVQPNS